VNSKRCVGAAEQGPTKQPAISWLKNLCAVISLVLLENRK
jgi:hypothetical protein